MSIIQTVTDPNHFWGWIQSSDNYKNSFSFDGADALQAYLENLSDETGENVEFDPIAWACSFSEYTDFDNFQHDTGYTDAKGVKHKGYDGINSLDELKDYTTVIEFDGGIIVQDF